MNDPLVSSRWIQEFSKHLFRRQHVILYGNIHDQFLWRGTYQSMGLFLMQYFQDLNFDVVVRYDPIDGLVYGQPDMRETFDRIAREALQPEENSTSENSVGVAAPEPRPGRRRNPGAVLQNIGQGIRRRLAPEEAFGRLRTLMAQGTVPSVAVVDLGDMLTADPERYTTEERNTLILLKKCTLEAEIIHQGPLTGYRNTIVILANDLQRVPVWFYGHNPYTALVQVTLPKTAERQLFFQRFSSGFFEGKSLSTPEITAAAAELAELTEGFQTLDLEALRHTSHREQIPLHPQHLLRLVDFYKFGQREEPFEQLSPAKVRQANQALSQAVIGQPQAVEAVTTMLTSAKVGISMGQGQGRTGRPKGGFLFCGADGGREDGISKIVDPVNFWG